MNNIFNSEEDARVSSITSLLRDNQFKTRRKFAPKGLWRQRALAQTKTQKEEKHGGRATCFVLQENCIISRIRPVFRSRSKLTIRHIYLQFLPTLSAFTAVVGRLTSRDSSWSPCPDPPWPPNSTRTVSRPSRIDLSESWNSRFSQIKLFAMASKSRESMNNSVPKTYNKSQNNFFYGSFFKQI